MNSVVVKSFNTAYNLTMLSVELPDGKNTANTTALMLHHLFMELNPYALMTPTSIDKVHQLLIDKSLKNFFVRLTSRFQFALSQLDSDIDVREIYEHIWDACNVHNTLLIDGAVIKAVNKLGDENAEQQLTVEEGISLLAHNRWYAMVCLFTLVYTGG